MINFTRIGITLACMVISTFAQASTYQLDISGSFIYSTPNPSPSDTLDVPLAFSGSFLFSPLPDTPPFVSGDAVLYGDHPIEGQIVIDGEVYTMVSSELNNFGMVDSSVGTPDLFGFSYFFVNANGQQSPMGMNLYFNNDVIDGFEYTEFGVDDLVPFEFMNGLSSSIFAGGFGNNLIVGTFDTLEFRQVPLPASLWLFMAALGGLRFSGFFRRQSLS